MNNCVGPITDALIDKAISEVNKKKTKEKIMSGVIDPLLKDISNRYYPHFITITSMLAVIVLLLISVLILLIIQKMDSCTIYSRDNRVITL